MKKEYYRHILPYFQQPEQAYFVTWNLKDAVPPKAFIRYTQKLKMIKSQIELHRNLKSENFVIAHLQQEYKLTRDKYLKAYNDLLDANRNPATNLPKPSNIEIIFNTLLYWEGKKLKNLAFTIMPNHVHWILELLSQRTKLEILYFCRMYCNRSRDFQPTRLIKQKTDREIYGKRKVLIQPSEMKDIYLMQ